mgnify:CR=1 FL=1
MSYSSYNAGPFPRTEKYAPTFLDGDFCGRKSLEVNTLEDAGV